MKKWKSSQFNVSINVPEGGVVVRNLYTNNYILIRENTQLIDLLLNRQRPFLSDEPYTYELQRLGIVVEDGVEEYIKVDDFRNDIANSKERLDITILPTIDCNFRCVYCFENEGTKYMSEQDVSALIKYFSNTFKKYKSVYIQWFGGEPLLCKDLINYVMTNALQIADKNKTALVSGITTNGYELDLETYKMLCKNKCTWIQISVDGTRRTHNFQRPHKNDANSYDKIIKNLQSIRDNTNPGVCKIYYRVTLSKPILKHIDDILLFYKEEFSADKRFRLSLQPVMDWGGERIHDVRDELPSVKDTVDCLLKAADMGLLPIGHHTQSSSGLICESIRRNGIVVAPGNYIYKCPMAMYSKEDGDLYRSLIGRLGQDGQIYINDEFNAEWMRGKPFMGDKCHKCTYYAICHGNVTCPYSNKFSKENKNLCRKAIYDEFIPAEILNYYKIKKIDNVY